MDGVRVWMNETCGIPKDVITGFRAPNFDTSDALGQALVQLGFLYDSSVQEESYRQRPGRLDDPAFKLKCRVAPCLNWTGLPFWEVPTYGLEPPAGRRTNPGNVGNVTALQRLQNDWQRKQGSGVPTLIMAHRQYLEVPTERDDVVAFIGWALDQPNTWSVECGGVTGGWGGVPLQRGCVPRTAAAAWVPTAGSTPPYPQVSDLPAADCVPGGAAGHPH